jgi:S-adenosylmethionine:tRNA ribosyltransferase-isomerase
VVRTLESSVSTAGLVKPFNGWTNKFIFPPYEFKVPDMLVSNFHLPYSTLLMMVSAFAGYNLSFEAYKMAVKEKYRFGTYGDAMLIL